jgi:hypothetical protein
MITEQQYSDMIRRNTSIGQPVPKQPRVKAKGRLPEQKLNKTEAAYAQYLELQKSAGTIRWWGFEAMTIKLGFDCRFTPDFLVMLEDGSLELHDTKAGKNGKPRAEDDAIVKARVTGATFPIPIFFLWREKNGEWNRKEM